jgi:hypothetical protein
MYTSTRTSADEHRLGIWVHHHCRVHQQLVIDPLIHLRALHLAIQKESLWWQQRDVAAAAAAAAASQAST